MVSELMSNGDLYNMIGDCSRYQEVSWYNRQASRPCAAYGAACSMQPVISLSCSCLLPICSHTLQPIYCLAMRTHAVMQGTGDCPGCSPWHLLPPREPHHPPRHQGKALHCTFRCKPCHSRSRRLKCPCVVPTTSRQTLRDRSK